MCECVQRVRCIGHGEDLRPSFSPRLAAGCCQPLIIPPCHPVHLLIVPTVGGSGCRYKHEHTYTFTHSSTLMHIQAHTLTCAHICSHANTHTHIYTHIPSVSNQLEVKWGSKHGIGIPVTPKCSIPWSGWIRKRAGHPTSYLQ